MNRLVTQLKGLADIQDERVRRVTAEDNPEVQENLRSYFLSNFPQSMPKKIDALLLAIKRLQATPLGQDQKDFFAGFNNSVLATRQMQLAYDKSIRELFETAAKKQAMGPAVDEERLPEDEMTNFDAGRWAVYQSKFAALHTQMMRLSIALDNKLSQTLRRTEQKEKDNIFSLLIMVGIALAASGFGFGGFKSIYPTQRIGRISQGHPRRESERPSPRGNQ